MDDRPVVLAALCLMYALSAPAVGSPADQGAKIQRGARESSSRELPIEPYRRKIALVVGIDSYQNGISPLNYAVADAKAVSHLLETKFGFEVRLLVNEQAKKERILSEIIKLHDQTNREDQLLFFFAGHGKSFGDGAQESGYILPGNAVEGAEDIVWNSGIPMNELVSRLMKLPPKHILILLDTCFGGYAAVRPRGSSEGNPEQLLRRLTSLPGRHLLSAGKRGQPAMESMAWKHSAFVLEFLRGLGEGLADSNQDDLIPISELYAFLQREVTRRTHGAQTPHLAALDDGQGEFVFIRRRRWRPSLTKEGVRRKILIASTEVPLYRSPYSEDAREAPYLATYYLFEGEENQRVPVGELGWGTAPDGWLSVGSFVEWNSLEVALALPDGREPFLPLFADRSCALRFADGKGVEECMAIPLQHNSSRDGEISLIIPLLDRWGDAYRGIVLMLRRSGDRKEYQPFLPDLVGWLPRKAGTRPLIREAVFMRKSQALILANLVENFSLAAEEGFAEGSDSFSRKINTAFSAITGQTPDVAEPLDALMAKLSFLPFRTTALAFSLEEVHLWKPMDFHQLSQILKRKVQALREFLLNPKNVYTFNEKDHVFVPRDLFP